MLCWAVWLVFAANAPDLDFMPGFVIGDPNRFHHGPSHSLIAAPAFGLLVWLAARLMGIALHGRFAVMMALAYLSHLALDLVTSGPEWPFGMYLWWPFSDALVTAPFHLFLDIRRDPTASRFFISLVQWHNVRAVIQELAVMGGLWLVFKAVSRFAPAGAHPRRPIRER